MISDNEIAQVVGAEERMALGYLGEGSKIQSNRATLLDYYNQRPFGDEVEGMSQMVTSDVSDVVETMLPQLMRIFTQGKYIAKFTATDERYEQQAEDKTEYCQWVFSNQHDGDVILHDMFKDALLQYTGVVKVFWDDSEEVTADEYKNLDELEVMALKAEPKFRVNKARKNKEGLTDIEGEWIESTGRPAIENVPPDELLVARRARDFIDPPFIGQRTPRTRSELLEMGFDKSVVDTLGKDDDLDNEVKLARNYDLEEDYDTNPTNDRSKDIIYLGEYYVKMDSDGDGISELWQVFYANGKVLDKQRVDSHPFCVLVPVRMPHKAIGTCPADQVADIQYLKSNLLRQMLNNIYATNFNRMVVNERVELDDLLTPRPGGVVRIDGMGPIGDSVMPLPTDNQTPQILQSIEYTDTMREVRTGVTRYSQGVDTEILNKTATAFAGQRDSAQQRIELIARIAADTAVKHIFEKIAALASKYQDEAVQIRLYGETRQIDPTQWKYKTNCSIDVGIGSGDRQEKIGNLSFLIQQMKELIQLGAPIVDMKKLYNAYSRLIKEVGLKEPELFFNDPEVPQQLLIAEIEKLTRENQALQAQSQNMLAEAEQIKQQATTEREILKIQTKAQFDMMKAQQEQTQHDDKMAMELTKISSDIAQKEAETGRDINEDEILYVYDEATGRINRAV